MTQRTTFLSEEEEELATDRRTNFFFVDFVYCGVRGQNFKCYKRSTNAYSPSTSYSLEIGFSFVVKFKKKEKIPRTTNFTFENFKFSSTTIKLLILFVIFKAAWRKEVATDASTIIRLFLEECTARSLSDLSRFLHKTLYDL